MAKPRKFKSGAQKRAEKKAQERALLIDQARAAGLDVRLPSAPPPAADEDAPAANDQPASDFDDLGLPDLDDPETGLAYVRKVQLIAFSQIARSREIDSEKRWRLLREHAATIGMTHPRAALEAQFKKFKERKVKRREGAVKREAPHGVARPETARGRSGRRGPRPLSEHRTGPEEGEDP